MFTLFLCQKDIFDIKTSIDGSYFQANPYFYIAEFNIYETRKTIV